MNADSHTRDRASDLNNVCALASVAYHRTVTSAFICVHPRFYFFLAEGKGDLVSARKGKTENRG